MEIKTKKKVLSLCLIVALLGTLVIGASLAYFTDKAEANNTFTIGNNVEIGLAELVTDKVNNDDKSEGSDGLDDNTGYIVGKAKGGEINGFDYENCLPGATYAKKPVITIGENCNSSYVFAELEVSNIDKIHKMIEYANKYEYAGAKIDKSALNKAFLVGGYLTEDGANKSMVSYWTDTNKTLHIVYYVGKSEDIGSEATLFKGVKIPEKLSQEALNKLDTNAAIDFDVTAYAIQAKNIDNTKAAFGELFSGQTWMGKDSQNKDSDDGTPLVSKK